AWEDPPSQLTAFRFILVFHKQLLAGDAGRWLIGISGCLLFTNILLVLLLGWPARGRWGTSFLPPKTKVQTMAVWGWHRAIGLWLAPLGLIAVLTGPLMVWTTDLERA